MRNFGTTRAQVTRLVCSALLMGAMVVAVIDVRPGLAEGARMEGELSLEFESDRTFRSDDRDSRITDSYATVGLGTSWIFNPWFSLNGSFVGEPVLDPAPGRDRVFLRDTGVYVEEFYAQMQMGQARLFAGKFGASFGQAWDLTPGLYGTAFAEDYELAERVGGGLGHSAQGTFLGDIDFTASVFTLDRSGLSDSLIEQRGRTSLTAGGAGNTANPESFSLTLDGRNMQGLDGIAWHLGYARQARGETVDDLSDETGFVGGFYGSHALGDNLSFEWVGEIAHRQNAGGSLDHVTWFTLGGVVTLNERYNLALAHTTRAQDITGGADYNDRTSQISAGMEIYDGWSVDVGYKFSSEAHVKSQTVGVLLAKTFEFSTGDPE